MGLFSINITRGGVRTTIGPRWLRISFGGRNRTRVSTGAGGVTIGTPIGPKKKRRK
jgi:hypothetical protein